jgi:hypothetical protein
VVGNGLTLHHLMVLVVVTVLGHFVDHKKGMVALSQCQFWHQLEQNDNKLF